MFDVAINRDHKDRLFTFIFGRSENRRWTLSLYNAINGTAYTDPEEIEITTIDDVLYMGMKNDVSFILKDIMSIYEQQSTFNPNMPIRELMYVGKLYNKHIKMRGLNIYGKKTVKLPIPKLVVFYNGLDDKEDEVILKLSDAFDESQSSQSDIEVVVRMININYGHNKLLLDACKALDEYAWLINEIRKNCKLMEIEAAVDKAIDEMSNSAEIKPFLIKNRSEVKMSCLTEYDEEATLRMLAEESREEGREEERALLREALKLLGAGKTAEELISSGIDEQTVKLAIDARDAILSVS